MPRLCAIALPLIRTIMQTYLDLLYYIQQHGTDHKQDRTGKGRRRVFGVQKRFDISNGKYPLVTTRYINPLTPIKEMLMFVGGHHTTDFLHEHGSKLWDAWAVTEKTYSDYFQDLVDRGFATPEQGAIMAMSVEKDNIGSIGPLYGPMWRTWPINRHEIDLRATTRKVDDLPSDLVARLTESWNTLPEEKQIEIPLETWLIQHYYSCVDQLNELVLNLKSDPFGSRHVVTALNPEFTPVPGYSPDMNVLLGKGALMPCHFSFQVFVDPPKEEGGKNRLSLMFNLRSSDAPVGLPTNIAGYAFLAHLLAHVTDMETDELVYTGGDVHIYLNQLDGVEKQLAKTPLESPTITLNPEKKDLFAFTPADVTIENYLTDPEDKIVYPVAV